MTLTKEELARKLLNALNYSYECYMNEYSMESCNAATKALSNIRLAVTTAGYTEDELVEWVPGRGYRIR